MSTILVADDDRTCRDSVRMVLEREGYVVETAKDVDSALDSLERHDFDLIICDYRMPGKSGLDFLVELRKREFLVPVLMISAFADKETETAARELGSLEMLKKPFRRQELIYRIANALGG